jgi:hypothetical protein
LVSIDYITLTSKASGMITLLRLPSAEWLSTKSRPGLGALVKNWPGILSVGIVKAEQVVGLSDAAFRMTSFKVGTRASRPDQSQKLVRQTGRTIELHR